MAWHLHALMALPHPITPAYICSVHTLCNTHTHVRAHTRTHTRAGARTHKHTYLEHVHALYIHHAIRAHTHTHTRTHTHARARAHTRACAQTHISGAHSPARCAPDNVYTLKIGFLLTAGRHLCLECLVSQQEHGPTKVVKLNPPRKYTVQNPNTYWTLTCTHTPKGTNGEVPLRVMHP